MNPMNYKESGVDIDRANAFVEELKKKAPSIGGFGGMFKVPRGYEEPILVSGTDGVGTKIHMCCLGRDYSTIGIDLVAMCVNDIITSGAKPLYFLDYISLNTICPTAAEITDGIIKGCEMAGVELIGGETAEHPRAKDIDMAGFATGIVEKSEIVDGSLIKSGDKVIGVASSGFHANGYSLINDLLWRQKIYFDDMKEQLLEPTRIYSSMVDELMDEVPILGMTHITGGGITENLPRCLPKDMKVMIDWNSWPVPAPFLHICNAGEVPLEDMWRTFNMGIGYCLVVPPEVVDDTKAQIKDSYGWESWVIGETYIG